ncbi:MAG: cytidylate kinase family protein [Candidatus Aenigmarchaeota archaeon]|nr:cytidylate kinase family protein [Candidatus Aenigmarchaeota archaeon]
MIITIAGNLGSGKSTVAKILAAKLGYKHYSMGDLQRSIAKKRGITLVELQKLEEQDPSIDKEVDQTQIDLGKKEDNFVIDSRIGWHFIPHSIKVFLKVSDEAATKRIFDQKREDEKYNKTLEQTLKGIRDRKSSETKRFKENYNVDYEDVSNYDLVVDTTQIKAEQVAEKVLVFVKKKK